MVNPRSRRNDYFLNVFSTKTSVLVRGLLPKSPGKNRHFCLLGLTSRDNVRFSFP